MNDRYEAEQLVLRVQAGDEAAFEEIVKKYERLVYYIALPKMENRSQEINLTVKGTEIF